MQFSIILADSKAANKSYIFLITGLRDLISIIRWHKAVHHRVYLPSLVLSAPYRVCSSSPCQTTPAFLDHPYFQFCRLIPISNLQLLKGNHPALDETGQFFHGGAARIKGVCAAQWIDTFVAKAKSTIGRYFTYPRPTKLFHARRHTFHIKLLTTENYREGTCRVALQKEWKLGRSIKMTRREHSSLWGFNHALVRVAGWGHSSWQGWAGGATQGATTMWGRRREGCYGGTQCHEHVSTTTATFGASGVKRARITHFFKSREIYLVRCENRFGGQR